MKIKRIALLLCFCILASSLCSCTLIQRFISSHRNDESEQHEPTAREIFFDSLKAAFPKSENESSPEIKKRDYDSKERATLKFEKLDINGDPIIDSDLLIDIQAQYDADSEILKSDTVFKHFTTFFKFFPYIHAVTVKPWHVEKMHNVLKIYEFDDILEEYERNN